MVYNHLGLVKENFMKSTLTNFQSLSSHSVTCRGHCALIWVSATLPQFQLPNYALLSFSFFFLLCRHIVTLSNISCIASLAPRLSCLSL